LHRVLKSSHDIGMVRQLPGRELGVGALIVLALVTADSRCDVAYAQAPRRSQDPVPKDVSAPPADAVKTASGLYSRVLSPGSGTVHPAPADTVTVWYTGWTTAGKLVDSTATRGRPATFRLNRVMDGWKEGVQLMVAGERRRFWIPEPLAYKGRSDRPRGMIVFDIELISLDQAPAVPEDVAAVPADAEVSQSGLAWKILQPGTGTRHPARTSTVSVHYTGWTTDGNMFETTRSRGQPATFSLNEVIEGWTTGLQLMVEGERRRFWIPEELAYKGSPGSPQGMLVFDIELIEIR
jgi:peptidylprolyl isomerase